MSEVPTWEEFMIPVLRVLSDGVIRQKKELAGMTAENLHLSAEQKSQTLPSGQTRYINRIGWASSFLTNVGH